MPTRIVLDTNPVPSQLSNHPQGTGIIGTPQEQNIRQFSLNQYPHVQLNALRQQQQKDGRRDGAGGGAKPWSFHDGDDDDHHHHDASGNSGHDAFELSGTRNSDGGMTTDSMIQDGFDDAVANPRRPPTSASQDSNSAATTAAELESSPAMLPNGMNNNNNLRQRWPTRGTTVTEASYHSSPYRRASGFRSSILRELSVRQDWPSQPPGSRSYQNYNPSPSPAGMEHYAQQQEQQQPSSPTPPLPSPGPGPEGMVGGGGGDNVYHPPQQQQQQPPQQRYRGVSGADIRASPRFLGYLFSAIAGSVLLVSVVQFFEKEVYTNDDDISDFFNKTSIPEEAQDQFYATRSGLIYRWKLWGAIYASTSLVGLCILVMMVHYDTIFLPKVWMAMFRNGSSGERNLTLVLLLTWTGAVHVCTSSLSVGGVQANVYFTSWIAFGSIALTFGVWRESAGLPTLMDWMNQHKRETTYNWFWIMIFSIVFAGAATDLYYNRNEIGKRFDGEIGELQSDRWLYIMSVFWFEVLTCIVAIISNDLSKEEPRKLPCTCTRSSGTYRCVFGWRQMEGIVMIVWIIAKFWVIWEYTGVDGVINGLSNAYFGIWGSFFNSVFALGTWLKENQNMEYVVRDEPEDDDDDDHHTNNKNIRNNSQMVR